MANQQIIDWKRGQSIALVCTYVPETGWPTDLTGVTIASSIRDSRNQFHPLSVTLVDSTHFNLVGQTGGWYPGVASGDIQFSQNGTIFFTETFLVNVLQNVTAVPNENISPY